MKQHNGRVSSDLSNQQLLRVFPQAMCRGVAAIQTRQTWTRNREDLRGLMRRSPAHASGHPQTRRDGREKTEGKRKEEKKAVSWGRAKEARREIKGRDGVVRKFTLKYQTVIQGGKKVKQEVKRRVEPQRSSHLLQKRLTPVAPTLTWSPVRPATRSTLWRKTTSLPVPLLPSRRPLRATLTLPFSFITTLADMLSPTSSLLRPHIPIP